MTVFTWKKEDLKNLLNDLSTIGEPNCCTKKDVIDDLHSILAAMDLTGQPKIYVSQRGNQVYFTGRNPES